MGILQIIDFAGFVFWGTPAFWGGFAQGQNDRQLQKQIPFGDDKQERQNCPDSFESSSKGLRLRSG